MLEPSPPRDKLSPSDRVVDGRGMGITKGVVVWPSSGDVVAWGLSVVLSGIGVEGVFTGVLELAMGSCLLLMCFGNAAYLGTLGTAKAPSARHRMAASSTKESKRTMVASND